MAGVNTTGEPTPPVKGQTFRKYPKSLDDDAMCINRCKHNGKDKGNIIRCCLCAHWFHMGCVESTQDESGGVWPCHTCRVISYDMTHPHSTCGWKCWCMAMSYMQGYLLWYDPPALNINKLVDVINVQQIQINEITTMQVSSQTIIDSLKQDLPETITTQRNRNTMIVTGN